jgi:ABC-type multidrug transport system fused ATPase/permease subunit
VIASGLRGFIFSITSTNLIQRLRNRLFGCIMKQDIAFFDQTKTGEITSRLTSDITTVGEAISINLNIFLRSSVQTGKSRHRSSENNVSLSISWNNHDDVGPLVESLSSGVDHGSIGFWYG